jgi:23S rRNA (adenine2503-C2)-methyltransferase
MKVTACTGRDDLATVYIAEIEDGKYVEFLESVQPPIPREQKWVIIVSTLFGCPVKCSICDAGGDYRGRLSAEQILSQIEFLVKQRFPDGIIPAEKFKIQFARMGEPSLNMNVLDVIEQLPNLYDAPGLMPCISTVAPAGTDEFFDRLNEIKQRLYPANFQLQFSIHTTDEPTRDRLIPMKKWSFTQIADYGNRFYKNNGRKIALNCALIDGAPVDPKILLSHFDPDIFVVKITPLNPTYQAVRNGLESYINPYQGEQDYSVVQDLRNSGYHVIMSIGEVDENKIGSNCGQYVTNHLKEKSRMDDGYRYAIQEF